MPAILLTVPALEPLSLQEAKAYLRVEIDDDNDLIAALIVSARVHTEARTRRALIAQTWRLTLNAWPESVRIALLPAPLRSLTAVRVYRSDGTSDAVSPDAFTLDRATAPALVSFAPGAVPLPGRTTAGVEIEFVAGYGEAAADVPGALRQAIRLLVAHWYENRGLVAVGQSTNVLPETVAALIAPYVVLSL